MATHLTEEEQIEALKRWWSENWVTVVLPLIVGVLLYVGWFWWQDYKETQAEIASDKYDEIVSMMEDAAATEQGLTDEQQVEVISKAEALISAHGKTLYADMANLILGGLYVENNELDKAANFINRVVQSGANDGISLLARSRLAKVYLAQGRADEALMLVGQTDDPAYEGLFAEIRGDILLSKGEVAAANTAYKTALEKLGTQGLSRSGLLQTKISATAVVEPEAPAADASASQAAPAEEPLAQSSEAAGEAE